MKKALAVIAVIAFVIFALNAFRDQAKTVIAGEEYSGKGGIVTVEYVGRGDSVLVKFPGVFKLVDDMMSMTMVVYRTPEGRYCLAEMLFKQRFDHVNSTPPGTRQPSPQR